MTPTQIKIVIACVVVGAATFTMLGMNNQQTFTKHDLLGAVPGMSREQVRKLVISRKWSCEAAVPPATIACKTDAGPLTLNFADGSDEAKITTASVDLVNREKLSFADMTKSIASQYGRQPTSTSEAASLWQLDPTLTLKLEQVGPMRLTISRAR